MSGFGGWCGNDDYDFDDNRGQKSFKSAKKKHKSPGVKKSRATKRSKAKGSASPDDSSQTFHDFLRVTKLPVPTATHSLKSTANNVIITVLDMTSSMGVWRDEIRKRAASLFDEAKKYLGSEDLELLFIAYGDARTDYNVVQVSQFGSDAKLDDYLASFTDCGGGGQGSETPELVAYYLATQVDLSTAQNVYTFFITDESGCDSVNSRDVLEWLGIKKFNPEYANSRDLFNLLKRKMELYTILCETKNYPNQVGFINEWWHDIMGVERVLPLSDARRVIDVILGTMAKLTGQLDTFSKDLKQRQLPSPHGQVNVATVMTSISMVGKGTPSDPFTKKGAKQVKSLI